jgi:hypothetical protein
VKHWLKPTTGFLLLAFSGCNKEEETQYRLFNCEEDSALIDIGAEETLTGDEQCESIPLQSSSCLSDGEETVGEAYVWPCAAPIGTEHDIVIMVDPPYDNKIAKATVRLESDGRGEDEYRLTQDSANEGLYKLTLISVGSEGERRQDFVEFKLWEEDPTANEDD